MKRPVLALSAFLFVLASAMPALAQSNPNEWSTGPGVPTNVYYDGCMVSTDSDTIYVTPAYATYSLYKYTISTGVWSTMASLPYYAYYGHSMTHMPGTNYIYICFGGGQLPFARYNIATNTYESTLAAMPVAPSWGAEIVATTSKVYYIAGNAGTPTSFYEYTPGVPGSWLVKTSLPIAAYSGCSATYYTGDTNSIFVVPSYGSTSFYKYNISLNLWTTLAPVPIGVTYGGAITCDNANGQIYCFRGSSTNWYRYAIATNTWTALPALPGNPSYGSSCVVPQGSSILYGMPGGYTSEFWKFNIPAGTLITTGPPPVPVPVNYGGCMSPGPSLAGTVGDTLYLVAGGNTTSFYRYTCSTQTWTALAALPGTSYYGTSITYPGTGDYLYITRGFNTNTFWRYQVSTNSFTTMANTPDTIYYGASLCYGGNDRIYLFRGNFATSFYRYDMAGDFWEVMAPCPTIVGYGGSLVWTNNGTYADYLYAFPGYYDVNLYRYQMSTDTWQTGLASPTYTVAYGACMNYPGSGNNLFACTGYGSNYFRAYNFVTNTWTTKAAYPVASNWGRSLAYPGSDKYIYGTRGDGNTAFYRYWIDSDQPANPSGLGQFRLDGVTAIAQGGTCPEPGAKFKATVSTTDGVALKFQVEVLPVGSTFTGTATDETGWLLPPFPQAATVQKLGLTNGVQYKWQYRVINQFGKSTTWTAFGPTDPDFTVTNPATNNPPTNPAVGPSGTTQGQFQINGTTPIGIGALYNQKTVIFKGVSTDADGNSWRLQVELKATNVAFDGTTGLTLGNFAASGQSSDCPVTNLNDGSYHWRARAVDSLGNVSGWVSFGGNTENPPTNPAAVDFSLLINVPPSLPTNLTQLRTATMTPVPIGGGSTEAAVTFQATIVDPNAPDTIKLQVEVKPVGTNFDGTVLVESAFVANNFPTGVTASVALNTGTTPALANGQSYHWRCRVMDNSGLVSPWQSFGGNAESAPDFTCTPPPSDPTGLAQFKFDEVTSITTGGTTPESVFVIKGTVSDPAGDSVKLQVEVRTTATAYTSVFTHEANWGASGSSQTVFVQPSLVNGDYHWRARTMKQTGTVVSNWVSFGGNNENNPPGTPADTDITINAASPNSPPAAPPTTGPGMLQQYQFNGITVVPIGGTTPSSGIIAKAIISDPNAGTTVRLEVELKLLGVNFSGTPTSTGAYVASGTLAQCQDNGATTDGESYHWQARVRDSAGLTSAWVSFGANPETSADFTLASNPVPSDPWNLAQGTLTLSALNVGDSTTEPGVHIQANAGSNTPSSELVRNEYEVKPVNVAFDGSGTVFGPLVPQGSDGSVAGVDITGLTQGVSYQWRVRTVDAAGQPSGWVSFGGNADNPPTNPADADFVVPVIGGTNNPPVIATNGLDPTFGYGQFKSDSVTPIAVGATTDETTVVFFGGVTDPNAGTSVRMEFEVRKTDVAFTGTPTHFSNFIPNTGTVVKCTAYGLASGNYHWQGRAADAFGSTSTWQSFPQPTPNTENPPTNPAAVDFNVTAPNAAPTIDPLNVNNSQFKLDAVTPVAAGATNYQSGMVFKATVNDTDVGNTIRIQVQVKTTGSAFTGGDPIYSGNYVISGSQSQVAVSGLSPGNYMWQARAEDQDGAVSAWTPFGTTSTSEIDFVLAANTPPGSPTAVNQYKADGVTVLSVGATSDFSGVIIKGTIADSTPGDTVRLQVEIQPIGVAFTNTPSATSPAGAPGSVLTVTVNGMPTGSYHWQYRAIDSNDDTSSWSSFGGNGDPNGVDFAVINNTPPPIPTALDQLKVDGTTSIIIGGITDETTVKFVATVTDPNAGDTIKIQVEVKPAGTAFDGATGITDGNLVSSGGTSMATVPGLINGDYHWQVRAQDNNGASSAWVTFGGNPEPDGIDFTVFANGAPGTPTTLGQFKLDGTTPIGPGNDTDETGVIFKATVTDPEANNVSLQVEVQPTGTAFTGTPTATGTAVSSGSVASVTVSGLTSGNYHWQVRAQDSVGATSAWISFGTNPDDVNEKDFGVSLGASPTLGSTPTQHDEPADGPASAGFVDTDSSFTFKATVNDTDGGATIQLQAEVKLVTVAFNGTGLVTGAAVTNGQTAVVTVTGLADGAYHWRVRAIDNTGLTSVWVSGMLPNLDSPLPADTDFTIAIPPTIIGSVGQFKLDGTTAIAAGADTLENGVIFKAAVADGSPSAQIFVDVEIKAVGTALTGTPTHSGSVSVSSGQTAQVTGTPLTAGNYHWAIRARDSGGLTSAWSYFPVPPNTNNPASKDFGVSLGTAPSFASGPTQHDEPASASAPPGMISTNTSVTFKATASDPDAGQTMTFEVEIKDTATNFNGSGTLTTTGAIGAQLTITTTVPTDGTYHWRARLTDTNGLSSAWVNFGGNPDPSGVDFIIDAVNATPADPATLVQASSAGGTSLAAGTIVTSGTTMYFRATLTDADPSQQIRIQVEVQPDGTPFTGTPNAFGNYVNSGGVSEASYTVPGDGDYHWQVRAQDTYVPTPATSAWVPFNAGAPADFIIDVTNTTPGTISSAIQASSAGGTSLAAGSIVITGSTMYFRATVTDADPSQQVRVQVEVQPEGTAFTGTPNANGNYVNTGNVSEASYTVPGDGNYHWQIRAQDNFSSPTASAWFIFDAGATPDFVIDASNSTPGNISSAIQASSAGGPSLPIGTIVTVGTTMYFRATVTDADPSQQVRVQVEVQLEGTAFTDTPSASGNYVTSGNVSEVSFTVPADGNYHWQIRAQDNFSSPTAGNWYIFDASVTSDFIMDATNSNPSNPTGQNQYRLDGVTLIGAGATTPENGVIFKATVTDADPSNTVALEVEVQVQGTPFTNTPTATGNYVTTGNVSSVAVNGLANANYVWQYRAKDSLGGTSGWQLFGNTPDFIIALIGTPPTIGTPAPNQYDEAADASPVAEAFIDVDSTMAFKAVINDVDGGQTVRLRVEIKPQGTAFDGATGLYESSAVTPGSTAVTSATGLADGAYHWRYQAVDSNNLTSPWVEWAANGTPDFTIDAVNDPPADLSSAIQASSPGGTSLPAGSMVTSGTTMYFRATVTDPNSAIGQLVRVQVEVQPEGTGFTGTPNANGNFVASGNTSEASYTVPADGNYHWQIRVQDNYVSPAANSNWFIFDAGATPDFIFDASNTAPGSISSAIQASTAGGTQLPAGSIVTSGTTMFFRATVTDADPSQQVRVQIELQPVGTPLSGTPNALGNYVSSGGTSEASFTVPGDGAYHWQIRAQDNFSSPATSAWFVFDAGPTDDFVIDVSNSTPGTISSAIQASSAGGPTLPAGSIVTSGTTMFFRATVTDTDPSQQVRVQVEVQPEGTAFTGTPNANGNYVNTGNVSEASFTVPADGNYHWQIRAQDNFSSPTASAWFIFDAGATPDFVIDASNSTPGDITSAIQASSAGGTSLAAGTIVTSGSTMYFRATVTDADPSQQVRVQVEVQPEGTAFTGTPNANGNYVNTGNVSEASFTVPADGNYHWQIRAEDNFSSPAGGTWFVFDAAPTFDFVIDAASSNPTTPSGGGQFKLDTTTQILLGATTDENAVVFKCTVSDPDPSNTVAIEVELKDNAVLFNDTGVVTGSYVASGGTSSVTISGLSNGDYHWQYRARDSAGNVSAWVPFDAAPGADFTVFVAGTAPSVSSGPTQHDEPAAPSSGVGMMSVNASVTFKATLADADLPAQNLKLQVEIKPAGTAFDGSGILESAAVTDGQEAVITTTISTDGNYHWRARAIDANNLVSAWSDFGTPGNDAEVDFTVDAVNNPPTISGPQQYEADGTTVIPAGAITTGSTVVFKATMVDGDPSNTVTFTVERAPVGTGFASPSQASSAPVAPGQIATVTMTSIPDGDYEWRYRAADGTNTTSWVEFQPTGVADFIIDAVNATPAAISSAIQASSAGGTSLAPGSIVTTGTTMYFRSTVTDVDPSQLVRVQVEIQPTGTPFTGTPNANGNYVASGGTSEASFTVPADGTYHWQIRAQDNFSSPTASAWFIFDAGATPDFVIDATNSPPADIASAIQSIAAGGTSQPAGYIQTAAGTMFFRATVTDTDPSNQVRVQVEVKPAGTIFDGTTGLSLGNLVSTGGTSEVQVSGLADNAWHWRIRAVDSLGQPSAWFDFGANDPITGIDFHIDAVSSTPATPAGGDQYKLDTTTVIAVGATTDENAVVFKCTVTDADPSNTVAIEVELKDNAAAFNEAGLQVGSFVPSGGISSLTISGLSNGDYHWRYRARDSAGNFSSWVEFDAAPGADFTVFVAGTAPGMSSGPTQHDEPASPLSGVGMISTNTSVTFKATLTDADLPAQNLRLQIEIKPAGTAFDGTGLLESATVTDGQQATLTTTVATDGSYHWRGRAIDVNNLVSAWTDFGTPGNDAEVDFYIDAVNNPPTITGAEQYEADGTTVIPAGGTTLGSTVIFSATMVDGDPSNTVTFTVERAAAGTGFASPTQASSTPVAPGQVATVTMTSIPDGDYEWRYRASDGTNTTGWTEFQPTGATDFTINAVSSPPVITLGPTQHPDTASASVPAGYVKTTDGNMTFKITVTDADPGATAAIQVEIVANSGSFANTPTATGNYVSTGNVSEVTVTMPAGVYKWQARAIDNTGTTSTWTVFDAAPGADYTINGAPALPSVIGQFMLDATTAIAAGGTTAESGVVFKATVSDPEGSQVKLEVELIDNAASFTGTANTPAAPLVASGSDSTITVSGLANGSYKWRYRVVDQYGAATAWTDYPPGDPDFIVSAPVNNNPNTPSSLSQNHTDGVTLIAPGGTTSETTVVFKATVTDPDGDQVRIEVEVQPVGTAFTGTPTASVNPLVASGSVASATVSGLVSVTNYHWQVRAVDDNGAVSGWLSFGTDPDDVTEIDFIVDTSSNVAPNNPASLGQFRLDTTTPIGIGASTNENGVVFKATITDPDANLVRLHVEVKPNGTAFTNTPSATSAFMATGSIAQVTVSGLADGPYHWQAWVEDSAGALSGFVPFGGNPDFIIDVTNVNPDVPTADTQLKLDGITVIADGGTTNETSVIFRATVSDSDLTTVALQVEVVQNGSAFSNSPSATSPFVANGATAQVTVGGLSNLVSYKWQFRAIDPLGATSAWTQHGAGDPDFTVDTNNAPADPTGLGQRKLDGVTVIPNGGITDEAGATFWATLTDPDADNVRLQVEIQLTAVAFTNTPSATGTPVPSGSIGMATVTGLTPGAAYHWQVRTIDAGGKTSNWIVFAPNPAFSITPNVVPDIPSPTQNDPNTGTAVPVGARVYDATSMMFQAMVSDAGGETVRFEVEVQPIGTAFTNTATAMTALLPSGSLASITVPLADGTYHWQFRVVDASAFATAWTSFGGNTEAETDFQVTASGGSRNPRQCGSSAAGAANLAWLGILAVLGLMALRRRT